MASLVAQMLKNLPAVWETLVHSLGQEDPLEEGMPTHSSILAWRILMDRGDWRAQGCKESDMTERLIKNSWMEETRRRGSGSHALPKRATLHMLTNLVAPQISSFCVFMEALLHSHAWVLSCVWLFVTPRTVAHQVAMSMGFPRQKYWSGLPFPSPGDSPNSRIEPTFPAGRFFTTELPGKPGLYRQDSLNHSWEVKSLSHVWLCSPMDCSPPGSSIHGILQARVLEWVDISFSSRSSQLREKTLVSGIAGRCFTLWATGGGE